jgi:hypothetical protein
LHQPQQPNHALMGGQRNVVAQIDEKGLIACRAKSQAFAPIY